MGASPAVSADRLMKFARARGDFGPELGEKSAGVDELRRARSSVRSGARVIEWTGDREHLVAAYKLFRPYPKT